MACPDGRDEAFGPRIDPSCRTFDFTSKFEDTVLACIPAAIFICLTPASFAVLLRRPYVSGLRSRSLACQVIILLGLLETQLALLVLRREQSIFRSSASLAADILTFLATIGVLLHSVIHYQRSQRSSSLISLYLSAYAILGIARARTLWLISPVSAAAATLIATLVLTALALALDSVKPSEHASLLKDGGSPERTSVFWSSAVFAWLAATFSLGYAKVIPVDDLPHIDSKLGSDQLHPKLASAGNKCDRYSRHGILRACFRSYLWSFMSAIIPRLCLTAFPFSQPFLLNSTVLLVQQAHPNTDYGRERCGLDGKEARQEESERDESQSDGGCPDCFG